MRANRIAFVLVWGLLWYGKADALSLQEALDAADSISYGTVERHGKANPHGLKVTIPPNVPSIITDYYALRGRHGGARALDNLGLRNWSDFVRGISVGGLQAYPIANQLQVGIDFDAFAGYPVIASAPGTVRDIEEHPVFGTVIVLEHGPRMVGENVNEQSLQTIYLHTDTTNLRKGDRVQRGQLLARVRRESPHKRSGWHLFFIVGSQIQPIGNPHKYWCDGVGKVTPYESSRTYPPSCITAPLATRNTLADYFKAAPASRPSPSVGSEAPTDR